MGVLFQKPVRAFFLGGLIGLSIVGSSVLCQTASDSKSSGILEGHLKILSLKPVELADEAPATAGPAVTYSEYPLIIRSRPGEREIARITADANGNYHLALPPGDYMLDVLGRAPKRVRARPQPFTIVAHQVVRVDLEIDPGIR